MIFLCKLFIQLLKNMFCIADDMMIHFDVFVDLRPVDVDLYDLCLLSESSRVQGNTV